MFERTTIRDLDTAGVLDAVVTERAAADRAEANVLALAVHYVDLHPVTDEIPGAVWNPTTRSIVANGEPDAPLAGEGTPAVAEYAVEQLAGVLAVSYQTGLHLVADAVELCYRLPRLWRLVMDGKLKTWQARQLASRTTQLSRAAVDFVDRQAAVVDGRLDVAAINSLVHEARLQCDPDDAAGVEEAALAGRGVWFDHRESTATTDVTARLDTLDALDLDVSIGELATTMGHLGDERPLDIRRASALGMLAHPQRALDLATGGGVGSAPGLPSRYAPAPSSRADDFDTALGDDPGSGCAGPRTRQRMNGSRTTLYLHVSLADLATGSIGGRVEKLGAASLDLLRDWLQRSSEVHVRPVLDPACEDALDGHDPTEWMRESVVLRDGHCVFPGCTVDARSCDLDHIESYVSPDDGGPPGQTSVEKLACLCRRHHRLKTFTGWTYFRTDDGSYLWTAPDGRILHSGRVAA